MSIFIFSLRIWVFVEKVFSLLVYLSKKKKKKTIKGFHFCYETEKISVLRNLILIKRSKGKKRRRMERLLNRAISAVISKKHEHNTWNLATQIKGSFIPF